jgi:hypothetical protein
MSDYNGWTNYETWNWKLWMDNDYGTCQYYQEVMEEIIGKELESDDMRAYLLCEILESDCESMLEEWMPDQSGPFADILNAGINSINWYEIAENMLSDVDEAA